jgi:hypothetical protein
MAKTFHPPEISSRMASRSGIIFLGHRRPGEMKKFKWHPMATHVVSANQGYRRNSSGISNNGKMPLHVTMIQRGHTAGLKWLARAVNVQIIRIR